MEHKYKKEIEEKGQAILSSVDHKRTNGQYFTEYNPFDNAGFLQWAEECNLKHTTILEPFAGSNNLIEMLQDMGLCKQFASFDIEPQNVNIEKQDTLTDFPKGFDTCITNPPYLAQNSATRRGLPFPKTQYDDLYKYALDKCLKNCENVGAIIPASFLNSGLFRDRLSHYILLSKKMFNDTEHPVCLALFKGFSNDVDVYEDKKYLGKLTELEKKIPNSNKRFEMRFNDKKGKLGLIAIDNTKTASIHFCDGTQIEPERIKVSSRSITRIDVDCNIEKLIKTANEILNDFREQTADIFMTPFKGVRQDGKFRRRLDYAMARNILNESLSVM